MNTLDVLKYGNGTFLAAVNAIPVEYWTMSGVCGKWSVKDLVAHLASFEQMLVDLLVGFTGQDAPTPTLAAFMRDSVEFNDAQVEARHHKSTDEVLAEYTTAHAQVMQLAADLPADMCIAAGTLPWYGTQYSLNDFIVYTFYGHKREHSAQIDAFATTVKNTIVLDKFNAATNLRDIAGMAAQMSSDIVFDNTTPAPDGEITQGRDAVASLFDALFRNTPHTYFDLEKVNVQGDHATVLFRYDWHNEAGMTGHIRGVDVIRFENGLIAEKRSYVKG